MFETMSSLGRLKRAFPVVSLSVIPSDRIDGAGQGMVIGSPSTELEIKASAMSIWTGRRPAVKTPSIRRRRLGSACWRTISIPSSVPALTGGDVANTGDAVSADQEEGRAESSSSSESTVMTSA